MENITFLDTEVSEDSHRIMDYGAVKPDGRELRTNSGSQFRDFVTDSTFLCGHNLVAHDLVYLAPLLGPIEPERAIDTLLLSALLFPKHPYHALLKDDKLLNDEWNNPLSDAKKAMQLFFDEADTFRNLPETLRTLYTHLLVDQPGFTGFFHYIGRQNDESGDPETLLRPFETTNPEILLRSSESTVSTNPELLLRSFFLDRFCEHAHISSFLHEHPVELAYCLALLHAHDDRSLTPPWILHTYPETDRMMHALRGNPCLEGCPYCLEQLDARKGLKRFFGYDDYRTFDGIPLQEQAVDAAIAGKSLLAVFPTGGGKSITFQVPALLAGKAEKGLTVVLSPLQSLMKDQVDNLERMDITDAIAINGLLDPLERAEAIHRVESGDASILYLSPESLRSRTIERLLLQRRIVRFVIDEAHCFSAWGQDFRVDYLYIADFIRMLCQKKQLESIIPVSCFTATAKPNVIDDIRRHFRDKLGLELELFTTGSTRKNLHFHVTESGDNEKLEALRGLLETHQCPTIVYMSRTKAAVELANRLTKDGFPARPYHGQMDRQEKSANQDAFIRGEIGIMVATSAFGMGVDKKDVGLVVHYDISDSLENYVQEAGRAGRDPALEAECHVLYQEEDLNKHFVQLNHTKLGFSEIQQIWKAVKDATRFRPRLSRSAMEIARSAGWDESLGDVETRVKTAIAALELSGYVRRGQNMPHIYADSILAHNAQEAGEKIRSSPLFNEKDRESAIRIVNKLVASRSRQKAGTAEVPEARVDCIADDLGMEKAEVIRVITLLREAKVLADGKDLSAFLDETGTAARSLKVLHEVRMLEAFLLEALPESDTVVNRKDLNEKAEEAGIKQVSDRIRTVLNYWSIKQWVRREIVKSSPNLLHIRFLVPRATLRQQLARRVEIGRFVLQYLETSNLDHSKTLEFSVLELKDAFNDEVQLGREPAETEEIEGALFYLGRIGALRIDGGFLVIYSAICVDRLISDNKIRYKQEDYKALEQHYEQKMEMIHIVGEYARRMLENYASALQFVEDYFSLEYSIFRKKYFPGTKGEVIHRSLSPRMFQQIFGELSVPQLAIIQDHAASNIVVAAGPGSGKTRTLVHKLASLLLMENVRSEQLLMVTFSRSAASEFRLRLLALIHEPARYVAIQTFHSYCFDLLGRVGSLEKSADIVQRAVTAIRSGEVELARITKTVLVIDEAQDMDEHEAALVTALLEKNDDLRIIAVGDDDQNIYSFRGSDSRHLKALLVREGAVLHELVDNYRSRSSLVAYANAMAVRMQNRMKRTPIEAVSKEPGDIRLIQYRGKELLMPVAAKTLAALAGVSDAAGMRMMQGHPKDDGMQMMQGYPKDDGMQMIQGYPKDDGMQMQTERPDAVAAETIAPYQVQGHPPLKGTVGVLTSRNEEALQLVGLFQNAGIKASLLQSMETYELGNLQEIRAFLEALRLPSEFVTIPDENWEQAKGVLHRDFGSSRHLPMVQRLLKVFEEQSGKRRFVSDWHTFLRESSEEDFLRTEQAAVYVATMHKAKGREFDHVVLALGNFQMSDEASKRILYVAMTRARQSLTMHACGVLADSLLFRDQPHVRNLPGFTAEQDDQAYVVPEQLLVQMFFTDVYLGYFEFVQHRLAVLRSGDSLRVDAEGCLDKHGNRVLKFSKKGLAELGVWRAKGYVPSHATVNHVLYWWKAEEADGTAGAEEVDGAAGAEVNGVDVNEAKVNGAEVNGVDVAVADGADVDVDGSVVGKPIIVAGRNGIIAKTGKEILVMFPEIVLVRGEFLSKT